MSEKLSQSLTRTDTGAVRHPRCRRCGGPRHVTESNGTRWFYECNATEKTMNDNLDTQATEINNIVAECHGRSVAAGWYTDPATGEPLRRNVGEMLALIHSEVSEALEGHRKNLKDTHLAHRPMIEVELADVLIRIGDLAGYLKLDLGGAYAEKVRYNAIREDHKLETRKQAGGKSF